LAPTVGITATGFCYPGGILQLLHWQDQQILRLPTAATAISLHKIEDRKIKSRSCSGTHPSRIRPTTDQVDDTKFVEKKQMRSRRDHIHEAVAVVIIVLQKSSNQISSYKRTYYYLARA
jgi:hypothetical protein